MTPWGGMLRAAARLGLGPEAFWRLSLREWRMLTERPGGGLPIGLQLMAPAFEEARMLQVAHAYEQSHDWWRRMPEL